MEITYRALAHDVYWEITDSFTLVANGVESNKRKAKKAAQHAQRMASKDQEKK